MRGCAVEGMVRSLLDDDSAGVIEEAIEDERIESVWNETQMVGNWMRLEM